MKPENGSSNFIETFRVGKKQWIAAMGEAATAVFMAVNDAEPTQDALKVFVFNMDSEGMAALRDSAKEYLESQYQEFLLYAKWHGSTEKEAEVKARKMIGAKYREIAKDDNRNFSFLKPWLFREGN